ncbi:DUF3592 domain-containing protein [Hyalangium versicolor]|uniref:DUF3592 domain-containing protein n=1 Tax=Hyalangium versicolor TaxID=2861190 RepID=UPI001CC9EC90|nr:DUF3592 domain-containing protein [Hyalangium versicolor]
MSALGFVFLVAGVGLVVGGFIAMGRTKRFLASAREAQAEVVAVQERKGSENQRVYYPVFRFRTESGATQEVVSSDGSNPARYKEGDRVAILYDPAAPANVRIQGVAQVWAIPIILGVAGVIMLLVGAISLAV